MAASPTGLTIRMYNVGFGDCFLLSFAYHRSVRHVLVDFGSTSAPKNAPRDYMDRIASDIATVCNGKLTAIVATHRHRDHISGFSTTARSGRIIAGLKPDCVVQPWTEDPNARRNARTATSMLYRQGKPAQTAMTAHFMSALEDIQEMAAAVTYLTHHRRLAGEETVNQLRFIGEDNISNPSAVGNLLRMGRAGKSYYVNAGMRLRILPGVKCTVLGPPNLKQSDTIRKQRARDPSEFWQFRSFWAAQNAGLSASVASLRQRQQRARPPVRPPPNVRWFLKQAKLIQADQLLSIVRDLDSVMNNTSAILLLEIGKYKILLPGDAQIENWAYALNNPRWRKLLADVHLYKVGHHGSLNATPKSLWRLFQRRGVQQSPKRLSTLCSTKAGKHGSTRSGTEVPRRTLLAELKRDSNFVSSEDRQARFCHVTTLDLRPANGQEN